MKALLKFIIRVYAAVKITSLLALLHFVPGSWSSILAQLALAIPVYGMLRFAFEVKVADLVFKGEKIGEMREEE